MAALRWRPVAPLSDLHHHRPNACFAGGEALAVAWLEGRWVALRDRCPHRGSPLSQGRLVGGFLGRGARAIACPNHGWRLDREGAVREAGGCEVPVGACAASYPLLEAGGLLWAAVAPGGLAPSEAPRAPGSGPLALDEARPQQPPGVGLPRDARPWTRWALLYPADVVRTLVLADGRFEAIAPELFLGPGPGEALALVPLGPGAAEVVALGPAGLKAGPWPEPPWWGALVSPERREALPEGLGASWRLDA